MKKAEQISRHERAASMKKFYKRLTNRTLRRAARRCPENAPVRVAFFGYTG
jgi:hypothetical protein